MKTKTPTRSSGAKASKAEFSPLVPAKLHLKNILVPIDFSWPSKKALEYAIPFAEQFGAKITLLFVAEPVVYPTDFGFVPPVMENDVVVKAAREKLELLARQAMNPDLLEGIVVRSGTGYREITDAARTLKADLVIIATHGYTGLKHVLIGSTAERVIRHAPCPVLVVRETEREFIG